MKFNFNVRKLGGFALAEALCAVGDDFELHLTDDLPKNRLPAIIAVTRGSFNSVRPDGTVIPLQRGWSSHLGGIADGTSGVTPAGYRTIVAAEADSIYLCIRPTESQPFGCRRIELKAAEKTTIRAGAILVLASGELVIGGANKAAPLIALAQSGELEAAAVTDVVALEAWLK